MGLVKWWIYPNNEIELKLLRLWPIVSLNPSEGKEQILRDLGEGSNVAADRSDLAEKL